MDPAVGRRRLASWLGLIVLGGVVAAVLMRLPGSGGLAGELRWLLTQDTRVTDCQRRAAGLVILALDRRPGNAVALLDELARDPDPRVRNGVIAIVMDQMWHAGRMHAGLRSVIESWWDAARVEDKIVQPRAAVLAYALQHGDGREEVSAATFMMAEPPVASLAYEDARWALGATVILRRDDREAVEWLVFRDDCTSSPSVSHRLRLIEGVWAILPAELETDGLTENELAAQLRVSVADLVAMLSDPIDQVRWGAGRILAVAGDERGLPAFGDWLTQDDRYAGLATPLMEVLYGPDWRTRGAGGDSTGE